MKKIRIYIAGHNGMVGSSLVRLLEKKKNITIIKEDKRNLDLINQSSVKYFFEKKKIDQVYLSSAKVGGIYANSIYPAQFIYENIMIEANIIHSAFLTGVKKLLFLGSSCIYPKNSKHPIQENELLKGLLEQTNEPYAVAKIAGIKLCESYNRQYKKLGIDYRSIMPCNIYGTKDKYDPLNSHVIPALIRRFHEAKINKIKEIAVWGTGKPKREFLFVDDLARACVHIMNIKKNLYEQNTEPMCSHINVGCGEEITIKDLSEKIKNIVGYNGKILFDNTKPDGTKRKLMSNQRITKLGWRFRINLDNGLKKTYKDFLNRQCKL
jgi:GDP-L-fucose synthase